MPRAQTIQKGLYNRKKSSVHLFPGLEAVHNRCTLGAAHSRAYIWRLHFQRVNVIRLHMKEFSYRYLSFRSLCYPRLMVRTHQRCFWQIFSDLGHAIELSFIVEILEGLFSLHVAYFHSIISSTIGYSLQAITDTEESLIKTRNQKARTTICYIFEQLIIV